MESDQCPSMKQALKHNKPTSIEIRSTLADGLAVPTIGYNAFVTLKPLMDKLVSSMLRCIVKYINWLTRTVVVFAILYCSNRSGIIICEREGDKTANKILTLKKLKNTPPNLTHAVCMCSFGPVF